MNYEWIEPKYLIIGALLGLPVLGMSLFTMTLFVLSFIK